MNWCPALIPLYDEVVIDGDFNANLLDRDFKQTTTFITSLRSLNAAVVHNDVPMSFNSSVNPTFLDFFVFTYSDKIVSVGQFSSGLLDHDANIYIGNNF